MREIKFRAWDYNNECMIPWEKIKLEKEEGETTLSVVIYDDSVGDYYDDFPFMQYTGLKDKNGREIYEGDITELVVDGEIRRFVVNIKTVIREVVSHPSFFDETAKVAITGVVFEWNGFELFPCVDENGEFDNSKMIVVGNVLEHSYLLEGESIENQ